MIPCSLFAQIKSTVYIKQMHCDRLENCVQKLCCISYKLCVTHLFLFLAEIITNHIKYWSCVCAFAPLYLLSIVMSAQLSFLMYVFLNCLKRFVASLLFRMMLGF